VTDERPMDSGVFAGFSLGGGYGLEVATSY
jgi:hypothetical protein